MHAQQLSNTSQASKLNSPMPEYSSFRSPSSSFSSSPEEIAEIRRRDAIMQASLAWLGSPEFYQEVADRRRDQRVEAFIANVDYYYDLFYRLILVFSSACSFAATSYLFIVGWTGTAVHVLLEMSALISLSVAEFLFLFAQFAAAMQRAVVAKMFRISIVVVAIIGFVGTCLGDMMNNFLFDCCHCIVLTFVCFIFIILAIRSLSVTALTISNILELIIAPHFLFASACFDQLVIACTYSSHRAIDGVHKAASLPAYIWAVIAINTFDTAMGVSLRDQHNLPKEEMQLCIWFGAFCFLYVTSRYSAVLAASTEMYTDQMSGSFPPSFDKDADAGARTENGKVSLQVKHEPLSTSSSPAVVVSPIAVICPDTSKPTPAEPPPVEYSESESESESASDEDDEGLPFGAVMLWGRPPDLNFAETIREELRRSRVECTVTTARDAHAEPDNPIVNYDARFDGGNDAGIDEYEDIEMEDARSNADSDIEMADDSHADGYALFI
ncbi:hypothetical protein BCR43DRAFT_494257 [Syncephalastrum racemosum]|uniref:Transmembrane protein n=1 Tax=Syncephalastrum racemosum TaxID=13706 RepID=A0A1X2H7S7_SYNRA|nr:hypothetical protein BCR43DRAFT_494257 [Syncephalastrum racemosum]